MIEDTPIPTRTLVLGCVARDGSLNAGEVYGLAEACGMTDLQVRLCLRRLVSEGAIEHVSGRGRLAEFVARGESASSAILPELEFVDFAYRQDEGLEPWDGRWRLVGFSVSEDRRAARDELRDRLRYYGGAPVHGGLYVSPHAWEELVLPEAERLDLTGALTLIVCDELSFGGATEPREIAARLWPLDSLALAYDELIRRLELRFDRLSGEADLPGPAVVAGEVFKASLEFARAIEPDPLLPLELLPEGWPGMKARRRFLEIRGLLASFGLSDRFPFLFDRVAAVDSATAAAGGSPSAEAKSDVGEREGRLKRPVGATI